MRIIAGKKRGLKLFGFDGEDVRPTTDRVKENIFNMIAPRVPDACVLDLFAGTGALSVEALSRGAAEAVLCEKSETVRRLIAKNLEKTGFEDRCTIIAGNCFDFLLRNQKKFDIVFLDPPYNTGLLADALKKIVQCGCLSENGIVVAECDEPEKPSGICGLICEREKKYGRTYILIYSQKGKGLLYENSGVSGEL